MIRLLVFLSVLFVSVGCSNGSTGGSGDARVIWENKVVSLGSTFASNFLLTFAATIVPPQVNSTTLAADDIFMAPGVAYVSYNIPGAVHMGGIDQISTLVPALPIRLASTTFATTTVNGVHAYGSTVYSVGSTTSSTSSGWPAVLNTLSLSLFGSSQPTQTSLLNTYAGTAITYWNNSLYVLSGANGTSTTQGLSVLNPSTLAQTASLNIADARGLSFYPGQGNLYVVAGGGNLYEISTSNTIAHTINVGGNTIAESKSSVQAGKTMVAVSRGDAGAAIVCKADQQILASLPRQTVTGIDPSLTVTNGVAAGPGLLFVANGQAGVYVYQMLRNSSTASSCTGVTLTFIGSIQLPSQLYSANTVRYENGILFVAGGLGGFYAITLSVIQPLINGLLDFI